MDKVKKYKYNFFNPFIFAQIPRRAKVLDVGSGTGLLGERLKEEKEPVFVAAIEYDPAVVKTIKNRYDKVVFQNLEHIDSLPFEKEYFDVIVCSDVLEHLVDPLNSLIKLSDYLADNGFFLISVPNIAFFSVRLSLFFGIFRYRPGGILDKTHLHFYTKKSIIALLKEANLIPYYIKGYTYVRPIFFLLKILGFLFPTLFSIQFLIKAKKLKI